MNNPSDRGHYAGALVYNDQMISPLSGVLGEITEAQETEGQFRHPQAIQIILSCDSA